MSAGEIMLSDCLKECDWALEEVQSAPFSRDASGQVIEYGKAFWTVTFRYENLGDAAMRSLSAWCKRRKKAMITFTAYRPDRQRPLNGPTYNNSGLGITSVDVAAKTVTLSGLGGLEPSEGDMLSYKNDNGGWYVGEVIGVSGNVVTVEPYPDTPGGSPDAKLAFAVGEFQLNSTPQPGETAERVRTMTFTAVQVVRVA